jgi:predicted O-methyltransferase YrrM
VNPTPEATTVNRFVTTLIRKAKTTLGRLGGAKGATGHVGPGVAPAVTEDSFPGIELPFRSRLLSMARGEPQLGTDDKPHPLDHFTGISPAQGIAIHDLCVALKPKATLEIGLAYGYSTLYFLAALAKNGAGHHTAIDPCQHSHFSGIGLAHARAVAPVTGSGVAFRLIEDRSDRAAADLLRAGAAFDVIFIDGNHRFDDVVVDFYLSAQLCAAGGHVILDDMWMSSVKTVAAYVRANRTDFAEVPTAVPNMCVFRKVGDDTRLWSHFRRFDVAADSD